MKTIVSDDEKVSCICGSCKWRVSFEALQDHFGMKVGDDPKRVASNNLEAICNKAEQIKSKETVDGSGFVILKTGHWKTQ